MSCEVEQHVNSEEVDHVWITIDMGFGERVRVTVNTLSKRNRLAGFDARVRVGIVRSTWNDLPSKGAEVCSSFHYEDIESNANVFFEHYEQEAMERLLQDYCARACLLEVWGIPYLNLRQGIHQIHSRRASCAVSEDIVGRDGALKFYFEDRSANLLLIKFCGQP